jgi:hypothetical protein
MSNLLAHFTAWGTPYSKNLVAANREPALRASAVTSEKATSFAQRLSQHSSPPLAEKDPVGAPFTAWDLLDIINPLQHIPVISDLYRSATGDTIRPEIQLLGSTAVGGFLGFAGQLSNMVYASATGKTFGEAIGSALSGSTSASTTHHTPDAQLPDHAYRAYQRRDAATAPQITRVL